MRRREFITLLGSTAVPWPLAALAQQSARMRHVGVLMPLAASDPAARDEVAAFEQGLQELGWTAGGNVRLDYRWAASDSDRIRAYAKELVDLAPDLILVRGAPSLAALRPQTNSIPLVFVGVADPIEGGFVASLAQPRGNITGFTNHEYTMSGKWLEMLKEIAPSVTRVEVIQYPESPSAPGLFRSIETGAASSGMRLTRASVHDAAEIEQAIAGFARETNGGLLVMSDIVTTTHRQLIIALAARYRLPAVYPYRLFVTSGGLICYGADNVDLIRRAASYVDRILRGAKPSELPVQAPTKFELFINLKTAKALGLTVPSNLLAIADEVIE
jgi:putative ABC transport system substrate-binding protein